MGVTLVLARHGSTSANESGVFNGLEDLPLTDLGRSEAAQLSSRLPLLDWASVRSSDRKRCLETAALCGYEPDPEPAWRELDFGDLEGRTFAELDAATQQSLVEFDRFEAPGGESVRDLVHRVGNAVAGLAEGPHLVFTHGGVIRLLLRASSRDRHVPPGDIAQIETSELGWQRWI